MGCKFSEKLFNIPCDKINLEAKHCRKNDCSNWQDDRRSKLSDWEKRRNRAIYMRKYWKENGDKYKKHKENITSKRRAKNVNK